MTVNKPSFIDNLFIRGDEIISRHIKCGTYNLEYHVHIERWMIYE